MAARLLPLSIALTATIFLVWVPSMEAEKARATYCDLQADYPVKVDSVDIDPNPVISGKPATFKVFGNTGEVISEGKLEILVYFLGIHIHTETHDLCAKASCPIEKGSFVLTNSQSLPRMTPAGQYKLRMKMVASDESVLTCIDIKFRIVRHGLSDVLTDDLSADH